MGFGFGVLIILFLFFISLVLLSISGELIKVQRELEVFKSLMWRWYTDSDVEDKEGDTE